METKLDLTNQLRRPADTKVVMLVLDGLGGLPLGPGGRTELEAARTPNLDDLAARGICGLHQPVGTAITPGSGPGHLALFGYDPLRYQIGRGVLSALGSGFELTDRDVAARGNFCTIDEKGRVIDRRAGRISTERNSELCDKLRTIELPDIELFVQAVKEHRFLLVLRGDHLSGDVTDTDPQRTGVEPETARGRTDAREAQDSADLVRRFVAEAGERLRDEDPANMVLLRGFARLPSWPAFPDATGLRAAALADYPMYRGVARLIGMESLDPGHSMAEKIDRAREAWERFDFFFLHHKSTDAAGEDGDFERKMREIEKIDAALPALLALHPDVLVVTGDHSTPSSLAAHSWHPVPVVLWSPRCRPDRVGAFGERECMAGGLGPRLPATDLMPLVLAHAERLDKFGA